MRPLNLSIAFDLSCIQLIMFISVFMFPSLWIIIITFIALQIEYLEHLVQERFQSILEAKIDKNDHSAVDDHQR